MKNKKKSLNIRKIKKQAKGITLIALVVTIIVLLILAGIALNLTIGENGIFSRAEKAANTWRNAETNEQLALGELGNWIGNYLGENGNGGSQGGGSGDDQTGTTVVDGVPIPDGFYYVGGKKDTGLVISDNPADAKYQNQEIVPADGLIGNQFVWIPVDNSSEENFNKVFQRQEGYYNNKKGSTLSSCGEANAEGKNDKVTETTTTQTEAKAMYASVYKNGGFYVGRYEVGKDNSGVIVIKKGTEENPVKPYNNIKWSANGQMQETTGTTGGAVEVSRNFDAEKGYTSVTSTLIYGVQWDAIMNFIDPNYITNATIGNPNCEDSSYVKNSQGKGNYNESQNTNTWKNQVAPCGSSDDYRIKNIYDLAGNVYEWTMEAYSTNTRVYREGYYITSGSYHPASSRNYDHPDIYYDSFGFRVALYL